MVGPGKGDPVLERDRQALGSSGWDTVPPPTQPRGGSSSQLLKQGEGFQARQLLLPRHCSAACPLPLFYLQMPFYLWCYCWENPPLAGGRGSSAASCSAAVSRSASGTKAVKVSLNTGHHVCGFPAHQNACGNPLPKSHLPWGCWRLQACCRSHLSQLVEERAEFCAEPTEKSL